LERRRTDSQQMGGEVQAGRRAEGLSIRLVAPRALVVLAYMALMFGISSIPGSAIDRLGLSARWANLAHVPLFAGLSFASFWALQGARWLRGLGAALLCAAFAISDEWHQAFVPGRRFSALDLELDALGIVLGLGLAVLWAAGVPSIGKGGSRS
jgi:VanZ family protein